MISLSLCVGLRINLNPPLLFAPEISGFVVFCHHPSKQRDRRWRLRRRARYTRNRPCSRVIVFGVSSCAFRCSRAGRKLTRGARQLAAAFRASRWECGWQRARRRLMQSDESRAAGEGRYFGRCQGFPARRRRAFVCARIICCFLYLLFSACFSGRSAAAR